MVSERATHCQFLPLLVFLPEHPAVKMVLPLLIMNSQDDTVIKIAHGLLIRKQGSIK